MTMGVMSVDSQLRAVRGGPDKENNPMTMWVMLVDYRAVRGGPDKENNPMTMGVMSVDTEP